jgi:hypothetical protein
LSQNLLEGVRNISELMGSIVSISYNDAVAVLLAAGQVGKIATDRVFMHNERTMHLLSD